MDSNMAWKSNRPLPNTVTGIKGNTPWMIDAVNLRERRNGADYPFSTCPPIPEREAPFYVTCTESWIQLLRVGERTEAVNIYM